MSRRIAIAFLGAWLALLFAGNPRAQSFDEPAFQLRGTLANETALRLSDRAELTKVKNALSLTAAYEFSPACRLKLAGRAWYDAVFALGGDLSAAAEKEYETELALREAVLSLSGGPLHGRFGLQQIVWGEAPGVFITDLINPRDFREFVLPRFEDLRIPVWALDLTWLQEDFSLEGVWIPWPELDRLPAEGSEFRFLRAAPPPGLRVEERNPGNPSRKLRNAELGARLCWLRDGWDVSLLYLYAFDNFPAFRRTTAVDAGGEPVVEIIPEGLRVNIFGATFAKAWDPWVLKGELALTLDRPLESKNPADPDGLGRANVLTYAVQVDRALASWDLSVGLTGRAFHGAGGELQAEGTEYLFVRAAADFAFLGRELTFSALGALESGGRDYRLSPELTHALRPDLVLSAGLDIFGGPRRMLYGQFRDRDRLWLTLTYHFKN